jgi:hypothetical protein
MNKLLMVTATMLGLCAIPLAAQHNSPTHGDHNAHHGGAVDMWGTLHYEVVTPPTGNVMVYFTDEMRNDLPASAVQRLRAEIVRPDRSIEPLAMAISANGDYWIARSKPVTSAKSVIRLAFVHRGEQATVEIYGDMIPRLANAPPKPAPKAMAKPRPAASAKPKPVDPHAGH